MKSMDRKIGIGVLWNLVSLFITKGANTLFTIFLARLLVPEAFGLVAMATIVFELANIFVNSGFGSALIQSKTVTEKDLNTTFYTNILLSLIAYAIIFFSAPYVAEFYEQTELVLIIKVTGLVVIFNAARVVQTAVCSRAMDFKLIMKSNALGVIISGVLAIGAAWYGLGVWSLVIQMISSALMSVIILWFLSSWRPSVEYSFESFTRLFSFAKNLLVEGFLEVLFRNSYILVIGRFFGAEATGLYFFAKKISELISQQLTTAVQKATFPALAVMQDDNTGLKAKYRQIVQLMIFIIAPVMALLVGCAPLLIEVAFNKSWIAAVPYLQLLCVVGALYPLNAINTNLLMVKGESGILLKIGLIKKGVSLLLLFLSIPYGALGIIISQIVASIFSLLPNAYFANKLIGYSLITQVKDVLKPYTSALICGFISWLFIQQVEAYPLLLLIGAGLTGVLSYIFISYIFRAEGLMFIMSKLVNKYQSKV